MTIKWTNEYGVWLICSHQIAIDEMNCSHPVKLLHGLRLRPHYGCSLHPQGTPWRHSDCNGLCEYKYSLWLDSFIFIMGYISAKLYLKLIQLETISSNKERSVVLLKQLRWFDRKGCIWYTALYLIYYSRKYTHIHRRATLWRRISFCWKRWKCNRSCILWHQAAFQFTEHSNVYQKLCQLYNKETIKASHCWHFVCAGIPA